MRPRLLPHAALCAAATLALAPGAVAQTTSPLHTGHAIPGFYGLESSLRPTLGMSYSNRSVAYYATTQRDRGGDDAGVDGEVTHLSNFTTATWMSPWLLFGANVVMSATLPIQNSAQNPRSLDAGNDGIKIGDVYLQPLTMYWPLERGGLSLGYGVWLPTGRFDAADANSVGKGFLSHEVSFGWTHSPFRDEDWHYSVLARYSFHSEVDGLSLTPGDDLVVDWSLGKHVGERWNLGVLGYGVFQTSRDKGSDANRDLGYYGVGALGFEARYDMPNWGGYASARLYQEFQAYNHTEGQLGVLSLNFLL